MNIEQAIAILDEMLDKACYYPNRENDALDMAIEALREKAVKSKGCEYCDDNFKFWQTQISGELPNVRYCPMCGRQLEVEPMSELLPCPFCGGEAEIFEASEDFFFHNMY
jgi:predicted RNA-binding Zn-ribbon protein involved in translation (DUF1610 family)